MKLKNVFLVLSILLFMTGNASAFCITSEYDAWCYDTMIDIWHSPWEKLNDYFYDDGPPWYCGYEYSYSYQLPYRDDSSITTIVEVTEDTRTTSTTITTTETYSDLDRMTEGFYQ